MSELKTGNIERTTWDATRNRIFVAALLLALTLAGAVAARKIAQPDGNPGAGTLTTMPGVIPTGQVGPVSFGGRLDRSSVMQGGDGIARLELLIRGDRPDVATALHASTDLIVVLDRSGSMRGAPIVHALASVRELVSQLAPGDRFSLVTYASGAAQVIPLAHATDDARRVWRATLAGIRVGGGTNMASGIDMALHTVDGLSRNGRVPRVVLLSDGHANEGDSSFQGLVARARRAAIGEYVFSTVGVGEGFDENLMTALADAGTGNFYYVQRSEELGEVFAAEFASARETVATALEVQITLASNGSNWGGGEYPT
jgi:Ca-activated chloride channel family protein